MQAEHRVVDERRDGKHLEERVHVPPHAEPVGAAEWRGRVTRKGVARLEARVRTRGGLRRFASSGAPAAQALLLEAVERVDLLVLVVAAEQVHLQRVADLEREEQHEHLLGVGRGVRARVGAEDGVGVRFRERGHPHLERVRAAVDVVAEEEVRDVPGGDNQQNWADGCNVASGSLG